MRRLLVILVIMCAANPQAGAQPPDAKSPAESLKCIQTRPGFTVELMAAEPLVMSPIAFAWGPDGKFWVVEMGDYPLGVDGKGKPGGRVKFLEKSKPGDGPYDKVTVFLDGLAFPTGVTPYAKGVLITCAPDIFYAEDTDGDGKADKKEVLFTGFREGNQQHRVNGLVWGLDNWFYGANGDSGGKVKSLKTGKVVDISGRDFRLKPDTGEFEAVTGQTQFGRCRDDWGNWFGNNNTNPLYHFVLDDHYLKRNPYLLPPDPRVPVSVNPGASEVFPISKPLPRFNSPQALNHFTSACSAIIYRDDLFGPEFAGNSFVSEPVHNLIHREIVKPKGVTFTSQRAPDEQKSEFLASSDNWFRPTTIATGPDGALWVADMYRYVIEHPEWIPKDWQAKLDLRAGHTMGRIYRVYPKDKKPREILRVDKMDIKELCKQLNSPNGWMRDIAQQRLAAFQPGESAADLERHRAARDELRKVVKQSDSPRARLHALCALDELIRPYSDEIIVVLQDPHPSVRRQALRCLESYAHQQLPFFEQSLTKLVQDPDPQVRLQLAYTLGAWSTPHAAGLLTALLVDNKNDRFIVAAGLSSVGKENAKYLFAAMRKTPGGMIPALAPLLRFAKYAEPGDAARLLLENMPASGKLGAEQFGWAADLLESLEQAKTSLAEVLSSPKTGPTSAELLQQFESLHSEARQVAAKPQAALDSRKQAVRLLSHHREDFKLIAGLLSPQTADELQIAAINSLSKSTDVFVAGTLIRPWKGYSPGLRGQALDALMSRPLWTRMLVAAIDGKEIPPSEIDTPRRQRLLQHKDPEVRDTAAKVFAAYSSPDRRKLVDEYILTLPEKADPMRGAKLFARTCAACHKLGDIGQQVGPDLASVGDRSLQGLIVAILDPNRNVEARYVNYLAVTKDGRTLTGMLATETSTSVTLVGVDGKAHSLLRAEIEELTSTGKSVMPEGLERDLPPQAMADLLAFVRGNLPAPKGQEEK